MPNIRLSPAQKEVVHHLDGPLLVVAGPGSGKTRVLTERVRALLSRQEEHFRVLALTFTNKAANEMLDRLEDLGELRERTFTGTLHGFCLDMITNRGKPLGITSIPQIFEQRSDRRQILSEAVESDPFLSAELDNVTDSKGRNQLINHWLGAIGRIKAHPESLNPSEMEPTIERVYEAYNSSLRASGAVDFDDLLLLAYELLTGYPKIANFYRRLYRYVCVDEAQDLNEAQYCVLRAFCGDNYRNLMMVGDPKQSIYGFNTSSPKYMDQFQADFRAKRIELTENFRSSQAIVETARKLQSSYEVEGQLPIKGEVQIISSDDEKGEAGAVVKTIEGLMNRGHSDIEGEVTVDRVAILGRTRYTLLAVEDELGRQRVPFYKRLSSAHEFDSDEVKDLLLALRIVANPRDRFHFCSLCANWGVSSSAWREVGGADEAAALIAEIAQSSPEARSRVVSKAIEAVVHGANALDMTRAISVLRSYADRLEEEHRRAVHEDGAVLSKEWDEYLRATAVSNRTASSFMSNMALGATTNPKENGVALLTVHSSKGMEFDVVFVVGMADGVFPDYRARGDSQAMAEERRNAFVAVTRSRRLLYLSFSRTRIMPWGDVWRNRPSEFLHTMELIG